MKKKTKSISWWVKKLDAIISAYVRSGGDICFTCSVYVEGKNKQCGHFISRRHMATRFELDNLRIQCYRCNIWLNGNGAEFSIRLIKEIGLIRVEELVKKSRTIKQWTTKELNELCERYGELRKVD